ncbi:threonine-phosphate decarboxylase [Bacteroides propionicifaciens]|uniref:threonine-phosphate decarboxylase n=1 Tax=Bacteroides propionicifaciens TaxID=392838 RepID=UPI000360BFD4|nr:threonine-phosphate decarboxylase [Bacteroides propionicifaciens]
MIQGHGDDIYNQSAEIKCNFSSNVDTLQDLSELRAHLIEKINQIHSYPEPDATSFADLIAQKNSVLPQNICVTNGATEAIYLIAQSFRESRTAVVIPTFSEYEDACRLNSHALSFYTNLTDIPYDTELVWLCNPNNPTGKVYKKAEIRSFLSAHQNTVLIIDQSYEQFSREELFSLSEAIEYDNLILLHSLTKHFAIPGLRLGYFSATARLVEKIKSYKMPWSVNQLAIEAGKFLETHYTNLVDISTHMSRAKRLYEQLSQTEGLEVQGSQTHFFLCRIKDETRTASELKTYLLDSKGFLIRDASNFRGLSPQHFRIASQTEEANTELIQAIQKWI